MLLPNNKQKARLFEFAGTARFAYNWALDRQMKAFEKGEKFIRNNDLRKEFTVLRNSAGYEWMKTISNNVSKQAIKDSCDAYFKFFEKQKRTNIKYTKKKLAHLERIGKNPTVYDMNGHPKFKSRRNGNFKFYQDTDKIKITSTHVKLEKITTSKRKSRQKLNWIKLAEVDRIPVGVSYKQPRISYDGLNWWLSVSVECETSQDENCNEAIGIDLGLKDLAILSNGTVYPNINKTQVIKKMNKRKRKLQRRISRKYEINKTKGGTLKKTGNIIKSERQLLKLHHRLKNIRHNYIHQITSAIINRKPKLIVLEDLNIQGMMKNKHLAKAVQEQCLYEFRRQIEYKSEWSSIKVIVADRYYPSSKTCIKCGYIKKDLKLKERIYHCPQCDNEIDRDLQAAINLKIYGESH